MNVTTSCRRYGTFRIENYFKFLSSGGFEDCNQALKKIVSCIDMDKVFEIIDNIDIAIAVLKSHKILFTNHLNNKTYFIEKKKE